MPLPVAAKAARRVGRLIATRKLKALNNHSIQDIETWDDADEDTAQAIADEILKNRSVVGRGDDAQLLAGATWHCSHTPITMMRRLRCSTMRSTTVFVVIPSGDR